ncbi:MAG: Ig-like domain-containing protein [Bacteroidales bacterium]|nr:Ig-like domain-containing protein [Bacteroidales bacterium]
MKQTEISKARGWWKHLLLLCVTLLGVVGIVTAGTPNYPFPQNYKYPYGNIYTGSNVKDKIQSLYTTWLGKYYTEGTCKGQQCARIKFVQDGESGTNTVSEGIAYGMLIFVFMDNATNNTQDKFDRLWRYYQANANGNGFMNWKVNAFTGNVTSGSGNANGATDADVDVAQALMLAHKQWGSDGAINYKDAAEGMIARIWTHEVDQSAKVLKPGDAFNDYDNPCYFITNALELFKQFDKTHDWTSIVNGCYSLMGKVANGSTGLIPDWCYSDGRLLNGLIDGKFESIFGYDAVRIPWRLAHAYAWYGHEQAYNMASKITTWSQSKCGGNPASLKDGYTLAGQEGTGGLGGSLRSWGTSTNACFSSGLSIGAMVDSKFSSYMDQCWAVGNTSDPYGAYYTHTTQLLYMLCLTGNMPNFYDMIPVYESAETNSDGTKVYLNWTKGLKTTNVSGSRNAFVIKTYENAEDNTAEEISVRSVQRNADNIKQLILTLSSEISEPVITISYDGSVVLNANDDNAIAGTFEDKPVTNLITSMEPYPIARYTDLYGTIVYVQWSKPINADGASASDFTVKVNGTSYTPATIKVNDEDYSVLELNMGESIVPSSSAEVTVSYTPSGKITSTEGTKGAKAFSNAVVQNYFMTQTCYTILQGDVNPFGIKAGWAGAGLTWTTNVDLPSGSTNAKGYKFAQSGSAGGYISARGPIPDGDYDEYKEYFFTNKVKVKGKIYVTDNPNSESLTMRFCYTPDNDEYVWQTARNIEFSAAAMGKNKWFEFEETFPSPDPSVTYNAIMLFSSKTQGSEEGALTFYIDYIELCPPAPVVEPLYGRVSYDGYQVELHFSAAMRVPDIYSVTITEDGVEKEIVAAATKTGDAASVIYTLAEPISSPSTTVLASKGGTLKAADGRSAEDFYDFVVCNTTQMSVSTGWYDDFNDANDYVTANVGGAQTAVAFEEVVANEGKLAVEFKGVKAWAGPTIQTYTSGYDGYVMDLTGNEKVSFRAKLASGSSKTYKMRISMKDYINERASDGGGVWEDITFTNSYQTYNFDLGAKMYAEYGADPGDVDRTNIYQVLIYIVETVSADGGTITLPSTTIDFDWIKIGNPLILNVSPSRAMITVNEGNRDVAGVDENSTIQCTSSADGYIYVVPGDTPPQFSALEDSVVAGKGVKVACTAETQTNVSLDGIGWGFYYAYAYDPVVGALSTKVPVNIKDVTPPEIISLIGPDDKGKIAKDGSVAVVSNEKGTVYVVPASAASSIHEWADLVENDSWSLECEGGVPLEIPINAISGSEIGASFVCFVMDESTNVSLPSDAFTVAEVALDIVSIDFDDPELGSVTGNNIKVKASRPCDVFLVLASKDVDAATIDDPSVYTLKVEKEQSKLVYVLETAPIAEGAYLVYLLDGEEFAGPSSRLVLAAGFTPVEAISVATANQGSVNVGETKKVAISVLPSSATNKTLTATAEGGNATFEYSAEEGTYIVVTGAKSSAGTPITVTVSAAGIEDGADPVTTTFEITVVQLPESVTITGSESMVEGATQTLTAVVLPEDTDNKEVTWSVDGAAMLTNFITVDEDGKVTAKKETDGPITIKAVSKANEEISGTIGITIGAQLVTSISVSPATISVAKGGDASATVTIEPADATDKEIAISYSAENVVEAEYNNGVLTITGVAVGPTVVTLTNEKSGKSAEVEVTVTCPTQAPTADDVDQLQTICQGTATELTTKTDFTAVWYEAPTGGEALASTPATTAETAANTYTYYVAKVADGCESADRLEVTMSVTSKPTATITNEKLSFCETTTEVALTAEVSTNATWTATLGGEDVTAEVISGSTFNPSIKGAGTYTIKLSRGTEACGSTDSKEFVVSEAPEVTVTVPESICKNAEPVTLVASVDGGEWSGDGVAEGKFDPSNGSSSITYTYVSGACEVKTTNTFTVTPNPIPTIEGLKTKFCKNDDAQLFSALQVSPADGAFTIDGEDATGVDPSVLSADAHTVTYTVTKNGCTGSKDVAVTINDIPTVAFADYTATMCDNADAQTLTATPSNGTWSGNAPAGVFNPVGLEGDVVVTYMVTDANGCKNAGEATINVVKTVSPVLEKSVYGIVVGADVPELSAEGADIKWYATEGGDAVEATTYTPEMTTEAEKEVKVYVTNTVEGCESEAEVVTIKVTDCKTEPVTIAEVDAICFGQAIPTLTATGDGTSEIRWYNTKGESLGTGAEYTPAAEAITSAGSYKFFAAQYSEANACEGVQSAVTLTVKATPSAPSLTGNASCAGAAINNLVSTDAAFWYSAEDAEAVLTDAATVKYAPEGLDKTATFYARTELNGCYSDFVSVEYTINEAPAAPEVEATKACYGKNDDYLVKATASTGCTLQWYDDHGNALGNDASQKVTGVTQAAEYTYTVKQRSEQNCASAASEATLTVNALPTPKITMSQTEYCSSFDDEITLTADPDPATGTGVFKVNDVVATSFKPSSFAKNTVVTINYEYTDANGCTASASAKDVTIVDCEDSPVTAMQAVPASLVLKEKNATQKLTVIITTEQEGKYNQAVTWESLDPEIASVVDGVVTALSVGEATIRVSSNYTQGMYAESKVTVVFPVTAVAFSEESISLGSGQERDLSGLVSFEPEDAVVTYEWSAGAGLSISDAGVVTANETATDVTSNVMVTVKTADGTSKTANLVVNVSAQVVMVTSITLKEGATMTMQEGATYTMGKPIVSEATDKSYTWSIEGTGAEITADGVVTVTTGKSGDTFKVVATANDGSGVTGVCVVTISDKIVPIESVSFSEDGVYEIFASESIDMKELLVVAPDDATYSSIAWTVNNYGTIDENGVFSPNAEAINNTGISRQPVITATVTATDGKQTKATKQVIVHPDPMYVTKITIPESITVEEGDTYTFDKSDVKVEPYNAEDRTYTWSIKTEGAPASINEDGELSLTDAATPGNTFVVIATANDNMGVESNECLVTVVRKTIKLTGISVDKSELQLEAGGKATVVYVTLTPLETTQQEYEIIVSSNATSAIEVSDNKDGSFDVVGLNGVQDATITVKSVDNPAISTTLNATVKELVKSIRISGSQQMYVGNTINLVAQVGDATATDKSVTWASSDENVATVSQNGVVLGKGPGMVQITATANDGSGVSNYHDISVDKISVESITAKDITIEIGQTDKVKATITPSNATYTDLTYFIGDSDIASVDADGVVTGLKNGETQLTITAQADNIAFMIKVKVTLNRANKETLIRLIEDEVWGAYSVYNKVESGDIVIGWAKGQVTPLKYNEFQNAWMDAQTVRYEEFATQDAVNAAERRLYNAIKEMGENIDIDIEDAIDDVVVINAKVYPSVVTNTVTVAADNLKSIKIVSITGKVVAQEEAAGDEIEINASKFAQGAYKVIIETEDGVTSGSFIKK